MELPTFALFIVKMKKDKTVFFVKNEKDGLWTLPGGVPPGNCSSVTDFARQSLYPYFDMDLTIDSIRLLASPSAEIFLGDERSRCSIYNCKIYGTVRHERLRAGEVWFAPPDMLPFHSLTQDIRCVIQLPEVELCLARK